jgi:hypothetical protein
LFYFFYFNKTESISRREATTTVSIHHLESRTTQNQEGENDDGMTNMHITIWNVIKITKKVEERSKNVHIKLEAQSNSISSLSWNSGVGCTKMDVQIAYELRLSCSICLWKAEEIIFSTQLVSPQNSFGVDRNY